MTRNISTRRQGFAITEYVVGLFVIVMLFTTPILNGQSLARVLIDAVKREHAAYMYAQTLNQLQYTGKKRNRKR